MCPHTVIKKPRRSLTQVSSTFEGERLAADLREHHLFVFAVVVAECAYQLAMVLRYVEHDPEISIESY